jgi:hypothetical protein
MKGTATIVGVNCTLADLFLLLLCLQREQRTAQTIADRLCTIWWWWWWWEKHEPEFEFQDFKRGSEGIHPGAAKQGRR